MFTISICDLSMYSHIGRYAPINLNFARGRTTVITGPCGSGKSFILELAAGIKTPPTGAVCWNDTDIRAYSLKDLKRLRLSSAVSFQQPSLINYLSVRENLALPLKYHRIYPPDKIYRKVHALLKQFELTKQENNLPERISTGQKKLVSIARTLISTPQVLFLDEPTEGLDPIQKANLIDILNIINQIPTTTALISTGDSDLIQHLNPGICYLDGLKVHTFGNYEEYTTYAAGQDDEKQHSTSE
ncbi:MAG: ATP-binding cassette domain-containing protein [Fibrobacterota bacterium]